MSKERTVTVLSNSSALLTIPDDAAFKYVVMPMRI